MERLHVGSRRGWKANRRTRPIRKPGELKYQPREPYWRGDHELRAKVRRPAVEAAAEAKRERRRLRNLAAK